MAYLDTIIRKGTEYEIRDTDAQNKITQITDDMIAVSDTQPSGDSNKVWIKETTSEVDVPTMAEHNALADDVEQNTEDISALDSRLDGYENIFTGNVDTSVQNWLGAHPEATTTVQDGSITAAKFASGVIDPTLSISGAAAEAKATGDAVGELRSAFFNNAYSENLCGTTALELYPVALKQNSYITVSTSDGSVFPSSPVIRLRIYDVNKTMIDYYTLSAGQTSRIIKLSADVYYLTIDGTMANPFMVNVGRSVAPYVPYFPGVKKLKELIDKNATDITAINNELDTLENTYFKWGRPYLGNNSLLNPTNITGGIYSFGPTNQNSDYPDDWEGSLYGALFYFNNVDIIIRQAGTANVWLKANNSTWITLHNSYGVVELNKDKDALIQQIKYGRPTLLGTDHLLSFIHFSDVHAKLANWNRVLKFANAYADFFAFVIHTGDYVRNDQSNAVDLYGDGIACDLPVLNTVGNHDIYTDFASRTVAPIATTRSIIFPDDTTGWGVTFGPSTDAMYYYKDFPTEKVRLVVLDEYYNLAEQTTWLADILADAKSNGYHVLTATHEVTKPITLFSDNTFCAYDAEELTVAGLNHSSSPFDAVIKTFKDGGGVHIANLCGHEHVDMMGKTDAGIFNIVIGTSFELTADASDANRVNNTVTQDLFNCVGINTNTGVIKLIRIGCDTDHYLRSRKTLAYNYLNDVLIANT